MKTFAVTLLALASVCSSLPLKASGIRERQTDLEVKTDQLLFSTSMEDFQTARAAQDPPELDWTSNGCTASPDEPLGFNFRDSCYRHDFGYRNYKAQGRFSDDNKDLIDLNFKKDLYNECATEGLISEGICKGVADVYFEAVSAFGQKRSIEEQ
ncbi:hypothetical protein LTR05_002350 [Lithohypha guttulata]|uniref:Uncharacterized protein n=1 Tax=Lithohypha guttulata TaxID=1690604 RepID=A0AAN7T411_9EURO|nr:hypothetical protein LTR05_002350 [Lithohypha guttulata]